MTLIITAVTPNVTVMGTDSAISIGNKGEGTGLFWTGQQKLFMWRPMNVGVSIFGTFPPLIDTEPFGSWIQSWYGRKVGTRPIDADGLAQLLCKDLDKYIPAEYATPVGMHLAWWTTWELLPGPTLPTVMEISRVDGKYSAKGMIGLDLMKKFHEHRSRPDHPEYAMVFFAAGWPTLGPIELESLRNLFSTIVRQRVPDGNLDAVHEYVRLVISTVAWLYPISGQPRYVNEPVETLVLTPEPAYAIRFGR